MNNVKDLQKILVRLEELQPEFFGVDYYVDSQGEQVPSSSISDFLDVPNELINELFKVFSVLTSPKNVILEAVCEENDIEDFSAAKVIGYKEDGVLFLLNTFKGEEFFMPLELTELIQMLQLDLGEEND